jgi:HK97 gp10 family phage protein
MDVKVEGLQELNELLKRTLPDHIQTKALHPTLAKAAQPIVRQARANAPVKTGRLRRAIYSFKDRASTKVKAIRLISVRSGRRHGDKDAYYWKWLEFGRGPSRARSGVLGTPDRGFFGKEVKAVPAQPFMRPAFESKKLEALEVFRTNMASEIQKAAERYSRGIVNRLRRKVFGQ